MTRGEGNWASAERLIGGERKERWTAEGGYRQSIVDDRSSRATPPTLISFVLVKLTTSVEGSGSLLCSGLVFGSGFKNRLVAKVYAPPMAICCGYSCVLETQPRPLHSKRAAAARGNLAQLPQTNTWSSCLDHVPRQPRATALLPITSWTVGFSAVRLPDFLAGGASELQGLGS